MNVAMIPARLGSQRLKKKNLRIINGTTLIERAIVKCKQAKCFDKIFVNSESEIFKKYAIKHKVDFHLRPKNLGDNSATSEEFVEEFLIKNECTNLIQVHSIAPLLTTKEVKNFSNHFFKTDYDVLLSYIQDKIEVAYKNKPVNFSFLEKTNSQDLLPTQRITWSLTGWRRSKFLKAKEQNKCATYQGKIGFFEVSSLSGHVIKDEKDLKIAKALIKII